MNTTGLIVEYNPFHNGHQYHLNKSKKITKNDNTIAIMSGNFTQRGDAAILDKWARTEQALECGVDLVIELPLAYNIRSAEFFAYYSVLILEKTNLVNSIVFGSETADINILNAVAASLINEGDDFKKRLEEHLKKGYNFPTARQYALLKTQAKNKHLKDYDQKILKKTLGTPNNILAIEYLKSLLKLDSKIKAYPIKRIGTAYDSQDINKNYASASLIRNLINAKDKKESLLKLKKLIPFKSWKILKREIKLGRYVKNNSQYVITAKIIDQLRRMTKKDLLDYKNISNGFENRLLKKAAAQIEIKKFVENVKAKNLTESRLKRILLQIYFGLDSKKINCIEKKAPHYIRVLGVRKNKEHLLSKLKKESELKLILNPSSQINSIDLEKYKSMDLSLSYDLLASDLYALLYENKKYSNANRDFYQKFIKV